MIRVENVVKSYDITPVIRNVSLELSSGHIYGLLGANGAGKTTLIKLLCGIYRPDEGSITMDGKDVSEDPITREDIAYVPDNILFYNNFTVKEMKSFYSQAYKNWNEERYQELRKIFTFPEKKRIKHLSKGMKTQLSILMSLSSMPKVVLMDEPTSGLDPFIKNEVMNLLVEDMADRGTAMLISSHEISQIEQVSDKVGFMEKGELLLQEDLEELKRKYKKVQIAFEEEMPEEFKKEFDLVSVKRSGRIYELIIDMNYSLFRSQVNKYRPILVEDLDMTLEEIFIFKMGKKNLTSSLLAEKEGANE